MTDETRFELQRAIVQNELELHYQPIVGLQHRELRGVEALVRWRHPQRGVVPPGQFVPAVERAGLARALTVWVLREALLQSSVWRRDGAAVTVAVNLSPENLHDAHFRRYLDLTLKVAGAPSLLVTELPAAALLDAPLEPLMRMRERGIRVAVDDVTENNPALAQIPADTVKIGRSLIARVASDADARTRAAAIARDARALGREITAVGVEDAATWDVVAGLGCDAVQGYAVSPPRKTADLAAWRRGRA